MFVYGRLHWASKCAKVMQKNSLEFRNSVGPNLGKLINRKPPEDVLSLTRQGLAALQTQYPQSLFLNNADSTSIYIPVGLPRGFSHFCVESKNLHTHKRKLN